MQMNYFDVVVDYSLDDSLVGVREKVKNWNVPQVASIVTYKGKQFRVAEIDINLDDPNEPMLCHLVEIIYP